MALREMPVMTDSLVRTLMALEEGWNIFKRGPAAHRAGFHTPPLVSLQSVDQFYNLSDISPCMQISLWENHCPQQNIGQSQYSNRTWKWPGTVFCRQEIGSLNNRRLCRFYSKSLINWYVRIGVVQTLKGRTHCTSVPDSWWGLLLVWGPQLQLWHLQTLGPHPPPTNYNADCRLSSDNHWTFRHLNIST